MGESFIFIFMIWYQQKCPNFLPKMSGILDPRIPPFRRSATSFTSINVFTILYNIFPLLFTKITVEQILYLFSSWFLVWWGSTIVNFKGIRFSDPLIWCIDVLTRNMCLCFGCFKLCSPKVRHLFHFGYTEFRGYKLSVNFPHIPAPISLSEQYAARALYYNAVS